MKPKAASYYKQNRLKQLRAFCYTAKSGSISKAAEQLYLSQPSVSLQIQALERELNTMLFERRGPKIRLTPDGQALLEIALPMVEGMDSLRDTFAERCGDLNSGYLNIAAGESTILYILPKFLKQFSEKWELSLTSQNRPILIEIVGALFLIALTGNFISASRIRAIQTGRTFYLS